MPWGAYKKNFVNDCSKGATFLLLAFFDSSNFKKNLLVKYFPEVIFSNFFFLGKCYISVRSSVSFGSTEKHFTNLERGGFALSRLVKYFSVLQKLPEVRAKVSETFLKNCKNAKNAKRQTLSNAQF